MNNNVTRIGLAKALGTTVGTVVYYTRVGLFPYVLRDLENPRSRKLYDIKVCSEIWQEVCEKRQNGTLLKDIVQDFQRTGRLTPTNKV